MPEITNNDRARLANSALAAFVNEGGDAGDECSNIADLFVDLFHLCDVYHINHEMIMECARASYREEISEQPKANLLALDGKTLADVERQAADISRFIKDLSTK